MNEFSKKKDRYFRLQEGVRRGIFKHNLFMPEEVVDGMIEEISPHLTADAKILILCNAEFAVSLIEDYPFTRENITLMTNGCPSLEKVAKKMKINTIETVLNSMEELVKGILNGENVDMRYNIVLGNPPFSDTGKKQQGRGRSKLLYPEFYKWSVENADVVAMIMPQSHTMRMKDHNDLLRKASLIVDVEEDVFKGVGMNMWTVYSGLEDQYEMDIIWAEDLAENNDLFFKGKLNVSTEKHMLERDFKKKGDATIFWKVTQEGVVTRYHPRKELNQSWMLPSSGYCVLMPQAIQSYGWSNTEIIKMDGNQAAGNGMSIAHFKTKRDAKAFVEYMKTDQFVEQALKVRSKLGGMTMGALRSIEISQ